MLLAVVVIVALPLLVGCRDPLADGASEEEILKAMHESPRVSHKVADFMIKDKDGIGLLAERLAKDPAAARQLFEAIAKKEGGEKVIALACLRAAEWERRNAANAQELQKRLAGGEQ